MKGGTKHSFYCFTLRSGKRTVHFGFIVLLSFMFFTSVAQDIHFSQFNFSPLNQNPANTGLFTGDYRFVGNYKNQWQSVPVAYNTASASAEMNFITLKNHDRISGGLCFYFDRAGDSKFTSSQLAYSMSYQLNFGKRDAHTIAAGYQIGFVNRSFNYTALFFDNQFNGDGFDHRIPAGEDFSRTNFMFLDMSAGVTYNWHKGFRNSITIGASVAHLNAPKQSFYNNNSVRLNRRYTAHIRAQLKVAKKLDIVGEFLFQRQDVKQEFVPGVHLKTYVYNKGASRIALNTGGYYRVGDAGAVLFGLDYNDLQVNFSYDINHSKFTPASRYNGGFEMSVIYIIARLKKIEEKNIGCPIF
ncbi:MAG: PorP/SprF family type IX secretion system membrane protein [Chitinophagales bacterium]